MNIKLINNGFSLAKITLIAVLPIFIIWLISLYGFYMYLFGNESSTKVGQFLVEDFYNVQLYLENACFAWLSIFMLGVLVQKYNGSKKLLIQKDLEKEQIEKEREIEKQKILTEQNELLEKLVNQRTEELKASQAQLIQTEKLASLGELTAGIAHEIQNPLNFVNNFSEITKELVDEAPKPPEGATKDWIPTEIPYGGWAVFFKDITQNLDKINHHGKRASSIVKGMLEHSRASTGEKVPTDINALCEEYLRLAYHGMRAKDKSFQCDYEFIADPTLPKINIVSQDISRVLLNLINNAFYAACSRHIPKEESKVAPFVTVKTKLLSEANAPFGGKAGIAVSIIDNGPGIPSDLLPKIFQPFFTTKPTGEGTGLGLSLSYDIVTKGHGGYLEVESQEGQGATFTLKLPI